MDALTVWHWLIPAVALLILEMLVPGAYLLWLGVAAGVTGVALWLVPGLSWEAQVVLFALTAVASIVGWTAYRRRHPVVSAQPNLNRRGTQYIGRVFTMKEPIVLGVGRVRVDDSLWTVAGPDCEPGAKVRVIGVDSIVLQVELVESPEPENG